MDVILKIVITVMITTVTLSRTSGISYLSRRDVLKTATFFKNSTHLFPESLQNSPFPYISGYQQLINFTVSFLPIEKNKRDSLRIPNFCYEIFIYSGRPAHPDYILSLMHHIIYISRHFRIVYDTLILLLTSVLFIF